MEPWIVTASGRSVYLDRPSPGQINVWDIAKALSQVCRWSGHTQWPYSVAQHSLLVADECQALEPDPRLAVLGLLHDAHVAYLGEVSGPLEELLGEPYADLKVRMQAMILAALGVEPPTPDEEAAICDADMQIVRAEAHLFFPDRAGTLDWPVPMFEGRPPRIEFKTQAESERQFLLMFTRSYWDARDALRLAIGR